MAQYTKVDLCWHADRNKDNVQVNYPGGKCVQFHRNAMDECGVPERISFHSKKVQLH